MNDMEDQNLSKIHNKVGVKREEAEIWVISAIFLVF